jgi:hypothetical protein
MPELHPLEGRTFEDVFTVECLPEQRICTLNQKGKLRKIEDIDSLVVALKTDADVEVNKYSSAVNSTTQPMVCRVESAKIYVGETSLICEQKQK